MKFLINEIQKEKPNWSLAEFPHYLAELIVFKLSELSHH